MTDFRETFYHQESSDHMIQEKSAHVKRTHAHLMATLLPSITTGLRSLSASAVSSGVES